MIAHFVLRNVMVGPQMEIITVAGREIRKLKSSLSSIEILYEDFNSDITGIDVNANEGAIYWSSGKSTLKNYSGVNPEMYTTA